MNDSPTAPVPAESGPRLTPKRKRALIIGGAAMAVIVVAVAVAIGGGDDDKTNLAVKNGRGSSKSGLSNSGADAPGASALDKKKLGKVGVTTTIQPDNGPVAPLTGLRLAAGANASRPALTVKIDNLDAARESALPQTGLTKADIVIEEIVEGNITRFVAIFQSQSPGAVGPVRSARTTDVHLLPQLGRTLLAWSGGNGGVVQAVRSSPSIIDVGADRAGGAYFRDRSRKAPHNLYVQTGDLWARAPAGTPPPPQLFQYRVPGQRNPASAKAASGVDLSWGGGLASSPVSWRWDPSLRLYVRSQRGRPHVDSTGTRLSAQNVVVLVTPYGKSPADLRSPEALTVGGGEAYIYSNGKLMHGRWARPSESKPAALFDSTNQPVLLTPGQTWIELPRAGGVTSR